MKIALVQVNPIVGGIDGNLEIVKEHLMQARDSGAEIIAFPEMVITGYPPQDLLFEKSFITKNKESVLKLAQYTKDIVVIVGFVDYNKDGDLFNAAAVFENGVLKRIVHKTLLPTYDVFAEARYFEPSSIDAIQPIAVKINGVEVRLGVEICEDLWDDDYDIKVTDILCSKESDIIINISSSPFHKGKRFERQKLLVDRAKKNNIPIFLVNLVGGQDELVFDGQSLGVDSSGNLIALGPQFEEATVLVDLDLETGLAESIDEPPYDEEEEIFNALVLGIRDYFRKTGFEKGVLGLSGGIDSAITACIATEALGKDNVIGVSMPSKFSSDHSRSDAQLLAENLGIEYVQLPIQDVVNEYHTALESAREQVRRRYGIDISEDDPVADENIQPRVRGNSLMDFSNRFRDLRILVLNTGNKTELALGYCTLYGDMTGGVGVIGDVSKIEVYELSEYYNKLKGSDVIPRGSITKKPSAELKEDQFDPFDFDIVSPLVDDIVEQRKGKKELLDMGYPKDVIDDVYRRVRIAEYKRWQAPPCIRITKKSFGMGWKMPIVNHYWE
ncbi:MAG: NAD+ synthase [Candidatus Thorarchaeota archaeon]